MRRSSSSSLTAVGICFFRDWLLSMVFGDIWDICFAATHMEDRPLTRELDTI